ncbi:hypothetical protein [Gryllotalpicola sp.]|uniref:hypothetical protein n=1 Tax=Gryllotalpicola sp. TaxID=1932787 RepID=UPI002612EC30|nr:hypothetical protein [Gryllotalpicola sp.]
MNWNDFVTWLASNAAEPTVFPAIVLFVAIVVSGIVAGAIGRGSVSGLLKQNQRQQRSQAITALVDAATEASVWNSLTPGEQVLSDRAVGQADILVRLLPVKSSTLVADWAAHQLAELKRNSATFGYNLDPAVAEFRDRLVEWDHRPGRTRRIFQNDLERWQFDTPTAEQQIIQQQDAWVAQQHHQRFSAPAAPAAAPAASAPPAVEPVTQIITPAPNYEPNYLVPPKLVVPAAPAATPVEPGANAPAVPKVRIEDTPTVAFTPGIDD